MSQKNKGNSKAKSHKSELLKQGEIYDVDIIDLTEEGEGVGKIEGMTVFVHNALPGDRVKTKLIKVKKQYAIGIIEQMMERSENRCEAPCPYARVCGGCQLQEYDYPAQLDFKEKVIHSSIQRIGKVENYQYDGTYGMAEPSHYRNKGIYQLAPFIQKKVNQKGEHKTKVTGYEMGFYRKRSHDIVHVDYCMLQSELANQVMNAINSLLPEFPVTFYDENVKKGALRRIMIRTNSPEKEGDQAVMLVFVVTKKEKALIDLINALVAKTPFIQSVYINYNADFGNNALSYDNEHFYGEKTIVDWIGDVRFKISPQSFFQVNSRQTEKLYDVTVDYVKAILADKPKGQKTVLDLYCGIGSIGAYLAKQIPEIEKIIGVEVIESAIEDAKVNAAFNGLTNTDYYVGKAETVMPQLAKEGIHADIVILDPPRKGCDEALLETLVKMGVEDIVYVSCKPSTLARDIAYLSQHGYKLGRVSGVDMFPMTGHVETVVMMSQKDK